MEIECFFTHVQHDCEGSYRFFKCIQGNHVGEIYVYCTRHAYGPSRIDQFVEISELDYLDWWSQQNWDE